MSWRVPRWRAAPAARSREQRARRPRRPGPRAGLPLATALVAVAFAGGIGVGQVVAPGEVAESTRAGTKASAAAELSTVAMLPVSPVLDDTTPRAGRTTVPRRPADPHALDAEGLGAADRAAGMLSAQVPDGASGHLVPVPGGEPAPGPGAVRTVRVEVEAGLPVEPNAFAATVMAVLNDPRGWGADGALSFARTDGEAELQVVLASPATVDALCAPLETVGQFSCARDGRAAINAARWAAAAPEFGLDRTLYRHYVVNHEVGHLLGEGHVDCPGAGLLAPVMQQQTVAVAPCVPNGWPYPTG